MKSRGQKRTFTGEKPTKPTPIRVKQAAFHGQIELCILAGGLSTRMGRDKAKLRIGGKSLLAHLRNTVGALRLPVRVIRRDVVPRCGPLGGIYTALKTTSSDVVLFLACDMPCVSEELLGTILDAMDSSDKAVFTFYEGKAGFPILIGRAALPVIERLLAEKKFSLQNLSRELGARLFRPRFRQKPALLNLNTPEEWAKFKKRTAKQTAESAMGPVNPPLARNRSSQ